MSRHDTDRLARLALDLKDDGLAPGRKRLELQRRVGEKEGQVDAVAHPLSVDAHNARADLQMELVGDAAGFDFGDSDHNSTFSDAAGVRPDGAEKLTRAPPSFNLTP